MNVLVTGGSGFVGRSVCEALRASGHSPRVLRRSPAARGASPDPVVLAGSMAGCDAVIHLVGIIAEVGQTFEQAHVQVTANLLAAARRAGVRRWIHMSALGTRAGAASRYHQTKWAAEQAVRASGLDWTIFRPSVIYGPGDRFINVFARLSRWSPFLPVIGHGRARLQPIAVGQVARAFDRALATPGAIGRTFDLCGPELLTVPDIYRQLAGVTGRRRIALPLPLPVARAMAMVLEPVCQNLLRRPPPFTRDQLLMLDEDLPGDGRPADELFGLEHPVFAEGIAAYLRG